MASVKEEADKDRKLMATNAVSAAAEEPDDDDDKSPAPAPAKRPAAGPSFFTIYKKGQGKWTRLGTVLVAALLGLLTAYNLNGYLQRFVPAPDPENLAASNAYIRHLTMLFLGLSVLFLVVYGFFVFWIINKAPNADFLIATDSEMKKVNWTTKGELVGSTRVVVLFLFVIALFLFCIDLFFGWFFHLIKVLT